LRPRTRLIVIAIVLIGAITAFGSPPVAGHEHVILGTYELIVGWTTEPAIVGALNGLDLGIVHHLSNGTNESVLGAETTLTATLRTGSASVVKALAPQFGRPGWYAFDVIPTREGAYSVRLLGTLNTTAVDVSVNLDLVGPRSDIEFPIADPTPSQLQDQITALARENAALRAQIGTALGVAYAGIALGIAGIAVGILQGRRKRTTP